MGRQVTTKIAFAERGCSSFSTAEHGAVRQRIRTARVVDHTDPDDPKVVRAG